MSCYHMNSTIHAYKSIYFITHICSIRYTSFKNKLMCISNNAMNDSLYLIHHISFIMPRLSFHRKERDAREQQNVPKWTALFDLHVTSYCALASSG